jgi:hypothetical protein
MFLDSLYTKVTLSFDLDFEDSEIDKCLEDHFAISSQIRNKPKSKEVKSSIILIGKSQEKSEFCVESLLMKIQVILYRVGDRKEKLLAKGPIT